jgi:hypothetical protein
MEKLYRIEELETTGWEPMDRNLTREICMERLEVYIAEGYNPKHLRVQLENESNS